MARPYRQTAWLVLLGAASSFQAHAISYDFGPIEGSFNTQISLGATMRTQDPDPTNYAIANTFEGEPGQARSANFDDGNIQYDAGEFTSVVAASSHELLAQWENFSFFTRFRFAYDFQKTGSSSKLGPQGESRDGRVNDLRDLFVQGRFRVFNRSLRVRLGRQVVSWGESTFIQNGINVINPIDVTSFRNPGSRIRDALLPTTAAHISYNLTRNLSMEALYLADFDHFEIDPRGAYFSTNDFASIDGNRAFAGFGRRKDDNVPPDPLNGPNANGDEQLFVERTFVSEPEGDEQFGLAFRYLAPWFNNTEFGFYYLNYDSRLPLISGIKGRPDFYSAGGGIANEPGGTRPPGTSGQYFVEYPENIDLFGVSFNTLGPMGIALQGEYSYRPNLPLQLAAVEVLLQGFDLSALGGPSDIPNNIADQRGAAQNGEVVQGYERVGAHQFQMTATQVFGPTFGASQLVVLGEAGVNYLDLEDGYLFNGGGTALPAQQAAADIVSGGSTQPGGYASSTSWGYRILGRLDYDNLIGSATVSPRLIFSHDVNGVGPNFTEGHQAAIVGVNVNYLQDWTFDLSYTNFFGGEIFRGEDTPGTGGAVPSQEQTFATNSNANIDRDFVSASITYSF